MTTNADGRVPDATARVVQVIETYLTVRGGTPREQDDGATARRVLQYWTFDGRLIAEIDDYGDGGAS